LTIGAGEGKVADTDEPERAPLREFPGRRAFMAWKKRPAARRTVCVSPPIRSFSESWSRFSLPIVSGSR
jgi:hypothetical protein